jgi:glycosyltransferase involved in cell wall biosynthesis
MSCVVPCRNQALAVSRLLPLLSDMLTEAGYPWELIALDCDSTDGTDGLLSAWAQFAGFHWMRLPSNTNTAVQLAAGLSSARGDAVILADPLTPHFAPLIPSMILQWEAQALLVYAVRDEVDGQSRLKQWDAEALERQKDASESFSLPRGVTHLSLMDRRLVDLLVLRR